MTQKINYYFDDDRVYAGSYPALEEAVAPPDNALWVAPPDGQPEGYAIVAKADRSGWEIVPDYRADGAYNQEGHWQKITSPGPLPDGWTVEPPEPPFTPGPEYEQRGEEWWKVRFSKKDFLLLCGIPQVAKLNVAVAAGNALAKTVHDLLMASEYIDVTDPDTGQMVQLLTTEAAGSVLTADQAETILKGTKYVEADKT